MRRWVIPFWLYSPSGRPLAGWMLLATTRVQVKSSKLWKWYSLAYGLHVQKNRYTRQTTYIWATADVGTCGDNSRPSRDEVAALTCTMLDSMWQETLSIREDRPRREDMFPVSQPLVHENFWCLIRSTHTWCRHCLSFSTSTGTLGSWLDILMDNSIFSSPGF